MAVPPVSRLKLSKSESSRVCRGRAVEHPLPFVFPARFIIRRWLWPSPADEAGPIITPAPYPPGSCLLFGDRDILLCDQNHFPGSQD
jgi:hypothetical protein